MPAPALLRIKPKLARQTARWRIVASCLALAALVVSGYWLIQPLGHPIETPQTMRFAVLPPSGFALEGAASRQSFALSPDGSRLAFTAMDSSGAFSVFLRNLSSIQPQLLAGSEGAHTVFWSPDSQSLYFTAKGKLWRTNLQDGARVLISESPSFLFSGAWLDSGRMLADSFTASYLVSPSGGALAAAERHLLVAAEAAGRQARLVRAARQSNRPLSSARTSAQRFKPNQRFA